MQSDQRGMTSVIGVILLVAVTVIIAAVAGVYIFSFETDSAIAPQASWDDSESFNDQNDLERLELTHVGGEQIDSDQLTVFIDGTEYDSNDDVFDSYPSGEITAGDSFVFDFDAGDSFTAGTEIWFVWEDPDPDSDETRIIFTYELGSDTA